MNSSDDGDDIADNDGLVKVLSVSFLLPLLRRAATAMPLMHAAIHQRTNVYSVYV